MAGTLFTLLAPAPSFAQDDPALAQDGLGGPQSDKPAIEFLDMPRADIMDVLRLLGESAQITIIPGRGVTGQVGLFLRNIDSEIALEQIIKANGYRSVREGDVVLVMTEQEFELYYGSDLEQRVFPLRFATAAQTVPLIQSALSTRGRAIPDISLNQIVVFDLPQRMDGVATLIEVLDGKNETRIFSLEHALVSDVRDILQSLVGDPSKLRVDPRTNRLIVTDTSDRLDFLAGIIEELDLEDLTETRTYTLKYVTAGDIVPLLEEMISGERRERSSPFGDNQGGGGVTSTGQTMPQIAQSFGSPMAQQARTLRDEGRSTLSRSTTRRGRAASARAIVPPDFSGGSAPLPAIVLSPVLSATPGSDSMVLESEARALGVRGMVIADERTNTLIITHTPTVLNRVEPVLDALDVERKLHVYTFQEADIALLDLERRLSELLPGDEPQFQVEIGTGTVMFHAPEDGADHIFEILRSWDKAPRQVYIEARVLRISMDVVRDLGVTIRANDRQNGGTELGTVLDSLFPPDIPDSPQGLLQFGDLTQDEYTVIIQALENEGFEDLLSTPKVTVIDRAQAHFGVAVDEPFVEVVTDANSDITRESTRFIPVGVILDVIPVINAGGKVKMEVRIEISTLVGRSANGAPIVDRSEASSIVLVEDGHTLAMGGLIVDSETSAVNKIPILGDIPFLGRLFQNSNKDTEKSEIIVFISPKIEAAGTQATPPDKLKLKDLPHREHDEDGPFARRNGRAKSVLPDSD